MNLDNNIFDGSLMPIDMGIYSNPRTIGIDLYQRQFPSHFSNAGNELPYLMPQMINSFGSYPTQQFHPYLYRPMIHEAINSSELTSEPNLLPSYRIANFVPPYPFQEGNFFPSSIMYFQNNSHHPKFFKENESYLQSIQEGFNHDNVLSYSPNDIQNPTNLSNMDNNIHHKLSKSRSNKLLSPSHCLNKSPLTLDIVPKNFQDRFKEELKNELKIVSDISDNNSSNQHQIVHHSMVENHSSDDYHVKFSQTNIIKLSSNTVFNVVSHEQNKGGVSDEKGMLAHINESMNHDYEEDCSNGCIDFTMNGSCNITCEKLPPNMEAIMLDSKDYLISNTTSVKDNKRHSPFNVQSTIANSSTMIAKKLDDSPSNKKNNKKNSMNSNITTNRKFGRKKIKELASNSWPSSSTSSPTTSIPIGVAKALQRSKSIDSKDEIINFSKSTETNNKECIMSEDFPIDARTNLIYPLDSESHFKEFDFNIKSPLDLCINSLHKSTIYNKPEGCSKCGRPYKVDVISRSTSPIVFIDFVQSIPDIKLNVEDNKLSVLSSNNMHQNNIGIHHYNHDNHPFLDADFKSNIFKNMLEDPSCQKTNLFLNLANKNCFAHSNMNSSLSKPCEKISKENTTGLLNCNHIEQNTTELYKCISELDHQKESNMQIMESSINGNVNDKYGTKDMNIISDNITLLRVDPDDGNGLNMLSSIALECKDSPEQLLRRRCSLLDFPISQLLMDSNDENDKNLKIDDNVPLTFSSSDESRVIRNGSSDNEVNEKLLLNKSQLKSEIINNINEINSKFMKQIKNKKKESNKQNYSKNSISNINIKNQHENTKNSKNLNSKDSFKNTSRKKLKRISEDKELNSEKKIKIKKIAKEQKNDDETFRTIKYLKNANLEISELVDGLNILYKRDNLYVEARLQAISPPDIYGILVENERTRKPDIVCQEEVLSNAVKIVKPKNKLELKEGMRVCAHWSRKFSCLYPGIVHYSSDDEKDDSIEDDDKGVTISFDDGDTGRIPIECVRVLPKNHSPKKKGRVQEQKQEDSLSYQRLKCNRDITKNDMKPMRRVTCKVLEKRVKQWTCYGDVTKRVMVKGKYKRIYFKSIKNGRHIINVGDSVAFISKRKSLLKFIGKVECFWQTQDGNAFVKVKWYYHPEETKGSGMILEKEGALFQSSHEDDNELQTIAHKVNVYSYHEYKSHTNPAEPLSGSRKHYYLAGTFEPTRNYIWYEPGVPLVGRDK